MPLEIVMPKLGLTMADGVVVAWKKREGDEVKKGEILFVIETEKVTFEVESPEDGTLAKILVKEKERVPVGTVVAYLLRKGEEVSDLPAVLAVGGEKATLETKEGAEAFSSGASADAKEAPGGRIIGIKASPLAKRIAQEYGLDLGSIEGTGPGGRILKEDVEKAYKDSQRKVDESAVVQGALKSKSVPQTQMRRTIAKRMLAAKVETAQIYMTNSIDATKIMECREILLPYIQEKFAIRVTITDILLKITGAAIKEHPIINTRWTEEGIQYFEDVHMGMAMALDDGLIVPVIRDINKKGIAQVARERLELVRKGKEKAFTLDDISGSTFTLSSMGMFGVEQFSAIINLPENGILGIGAALEKPVVVDGEIVIKPIMKMTLTYDHRTIDGAEAGRFMGTLKRFMENPVLLIA